MYKFSNMSALLSGKSVASLMVISSLIAQAFLFTTSVEAAQVCKRQAGERVKIEPIRQANVKAFERIAALFEEENTRQASAELSKLESKTDLSATERAYVANYRGNIHFSNENLNGALAQFRKILGICNGISHSFYNQIVYVVAQVYFSKEDYRNALDYAQAWKKTQEEPSADAFMLIGQAHYMLQDYNRSLPNVLKGIEMYEQVGEKPRESWLNLLASIYRQKNDFKNMLPVYQKLVSFYPKKLYLLALGGVYNELNQPKKMLAMYQALYDRGLLTKENELISLASLLLSLDNSHKASQIISSGMKNRQIKGSEKNFRLLSQSLMLSKEFADAVKPLETAAKISKNGKLYNQLGQTLVMLNRWSEAESALNKALNKGGLTSSGQTYISLGMTQFEQKKYEKSKSSFNKALKYEKTVRDANNWIKYVDSEVYRINELKKEIVINTDVEV